MGNTMRYVFGDSLEEIKKIKNRADGRYYLEKNATVYYKDRGECENPVAVAAKTIYGVMTLLESYISKLIEADEKDEIDWGMSLEDLDSLRGDIIKTMHDKQDAGRIDWIDEEELEKVEEMIRRLRK